MGIYSEVKYPVYKKNWRKLHRRWLTFLSLARIDNVHGLEQLVHFPTREKNTLDLILTSLPGQFQEIHSPDKLSDHDVISGTLKIHIPPKKETSEEGVLVPKGKF